MSPSGAAAARITCCVRIAYGTAPKTSPTPAGPCWCAAAPSSPSVRRTASMRATRRRIALPGTTLVPGLIDLHSHLFLHPYNETPWNDQVLKEPEAYRTLEAAQHARDTLLAGFTTLRDLGTEGAGYADVSVKRAIDEGMIPGPRLFVATRAIVATASYGPGPHGFRPDIDLPSGAQEASGVDAVLRAVREQAGHGADWIKVYADYRVGSRRQRTTDVHCGGNEGTGRSGASVRPSRGRAQRHRCRDAHGGRRRRGQHRTRLWRQRGDVQAHARTRRRVPADTDRGGSHRRVFQPLRVGIAADAEDARGRTCLSHGARRRRDDRLRQRCRRLPPRRQLARAGGDGATAACARWRRCAHARAWRRRSCGNKTASAASHRDCARTWWRSMAIRRRISRRCGTLHS